MYMNLGEDYDERVLPSITTEVLKAVVVSRHCSLINWYSCQYSQTSIILTHWDKTKLRVQIVENMNINEEQNCLNKATFYCETTLLQILWKPRWSTVHLEPLNTEPIKTVLLLLFKSKTNSILTALFSSKLYSL